MAEHTDQTLQEAVARALCTITRGTPDAMTINRDQKDVPYWMIYEPQARAAISTILKWQEENVSGAMQEAGGKCLQETWQDFGAGYMSHNVNSVTTFKAMISAMRKGMEG